MDDFITKLPKIELHAHLNGSLKIESIKELGQLMLGTKADDFMNFKSFNLFNTLDECFQKFKFMHELTATKAGLMKATQMVIRDFADDNVIYLELRTTPKANENMTLEEYLNVVLLGIQTADEVKSKQIFVKLLASIDRSRTLEQATKTLQLVKKLRAQNEEQSNLLVGVELSGNPKCGSFGHFKHLFEEARHDGLKLSFHCAEIDNAEETEEMLKFGMQRCGHGTFLNDAQIAELYRRNIAIECCLTSNVKCQTVPSYKDHHFKRIFQHEKLNNCSKFLLLCTDDSGVFDTTLSRELEIAVEHFDLNKQDLIQLQLNAVEHCFADTAEKDLLRQKILAYKTTVDVD